MYITTVGLDLAKQVFQVHGVDEPGKVVIRKQLRRKEAQSQHCCYYPQSRRLKMVVFSRWIGARFDGKLRMFATPDPVVKRGKTNNGKQRSLCQDEACSPHTFIRDYTKRGYLPSSEAPDYRPGSERQWESRHGPGVRHQHRYRSQ